MIYIMNKKIYRNVIQFLAPIEFRVVGLRNILIMHLIVPEETVGLEVEDHTSVVEAMECQVGLMAQMEPKEYKECINIQLLMRRVVLGSIQAHEASMVYYTPEEVELVLPQEELAEEEMAVVQNGIVMVKMELMV